MDDQHHEKGNWIYFTFIVYHEITGLVTILVHTEIKNGFIWRFYCNKPLLWTSFDLR